MTTGEKQKINVWIPGSLWKQIGSYGYESPTKATIAAYEALVLQEEKGSNQEVLGSSQEEVRKLQEEIRKGPDLAEFSQLCARSEEQERHISFLKEALDKAGHREEDLKQMHNNYFLQVQTLINQRAISAPARSTGKEESKPASQEEKPDIEHEVKPEVKQEGKAQIEKVCKNCLQPFLTENPKKEK